MTKRFERFIAVIALAAGLAIVATGPLQAQHDSKADTKPDVTGTWNMGLQGDHVIPTADRELRKAQRLPREHDSVFPRETEEHAGTRRQSSGEHAAPLRVADGGLQPAQSQARALFIAGRAAGALEGGLHLKANNGTPLADVMLSVLRALGFEGLERFGDSERAFDLNS